MLKKHINKFKYLLKDNEYYKAHETLEDLWFPIRRDRSDYTLVLKGFINSAVALELYKRDKIEQSKKIYKIFLKYTTNERISKLEDKHIFIELKGFVDDHFQKKDMV